MREVLHVHLLVNGKSHSWGTIRALFDFFFPYPEYDKNGVGIIRREAMFGFSVKTQICERHFYTFRAFFIHYFYELLINPFKQWKENYRAFWLAQEFRERHLWEIGAIAFDAAAYNAGTTDPDSFSFTCTGSNRQLFAGVIHYTYANGAKNLSGITYNSVSLTSINSRVWLGTDNKTYLYHLTNPASGANTVSFDYDAAPSSSQYVSSYSGAAQSGQPDANNTNGCSNCTSLATSVTTVADNCWAVLVGADNKVNFSAGTGLTIRNGDGGAEGIGDSNQNITPAGAYSMTATSTQSATMVACAASFAPAVDVVYSGRGIGRGIARGIMR